MSAIFKSLKIYFKKIGDVTSTIFLAVFYFTIFALFAIPARIFADFLRAGKKTSNFVQKKDPLESSLKEFLHEG